MADAEAGSTLQTALYQEPIFFWSKASVGGSDTRDIFKIVAPRNGYIDTKISELTNNLSISIYNNLGNLVASSNNSSKSDEETKAWAWGGGTYYISIDPVGSASSTYKISNVFKPSIFAMDVLHQAESHLGEKWGSKNCTGFVYTVSYELDAPFYLDNYQNGKPTTAYRNGGLISNGGNNVEYRVPITDEGGFSTQDYLDQWVVSYRTSVNEKGIKDNSKWNGDLASGDLIRLRLNSGNYHSGVVAGYDDYSGTLYLVDNNGKAADGKGAAIGISTYKLTDISGWANIQVERLESENINGAFLGNSENEIIGGGAGDDWILGLDGSDHLIGNSGNDFIIGGRGADTLVGGSGGDRFMYNETADSFGSRDADLISDFQSGIDKIDLSAIDANQTSETIFNLYASRGNQAFTVGGSNFTGKAGELIITPMTFANYLVQGDVNGDGVGDLSIRVHMSAGVSLLASDIIL